MTTLRSSDLAGCRGFRGQQRISRRRLLSIGAAGGLGLSLTDFWRAQRATAALPQSRSFGSAKHVIFLFLHGGHPQHETFDPKPDAPADVRGEFGQIATTLPGVHFSELLPRLAKIADRLAVVRSMSHDNTNHVQACLPAMTGHKHPESVRSRGDFPPSPENFPHFGAVVDHLRPSARHMPNWVQLGPVMTRNNGTVLHGQSPGFLGMQHSPLIIDEDFRAAKLKIDALDPRVDISRVRERRQLMGEFAAQRRLLDQAAESVRDSFYERAYNLLTSPKTRAAFDLGAEPQKMRQAYGDTHVGQACLLARRLVEAGAPFVNVHYCKTPRGSWDTHSKNFAQMKDSLGPTLDQSLATLIADLQQRGMLDEVLVVAMAEFGRTPQINRNAGRDHWPFVYSLALAGAGLARGVVHGASDRLGAYPQTPPRDPAEMAATIYWLLGVDPRAVIYDASERPHQLLAGSAIGEILT